MAHRLMSYEEENFWGKGKLFLVSWGWVLGCIGLSLFSYAHASKKKIENYTALCGRVEELTKLKQEALSLAEELRLEIQSQSDPKWIELTLMKGLGLVPEGQKKILFKEYLD